jgi:hypothetical protein
MHDRYGDNQDDDPDIVRMADYRSIDACDICDDNGYRGVTVCDHTDHTEAARRGMAMIRATMGWQTP